MLQRHPGPVHLPLVSLAPHLGAELVTLRESGGAQRMTLANQTLVFKILLIKLMQHSAMKTWLVKITI